MEKELIVKWKIKQTEVSNVLKLLPELAQKSKSEKGNLTYEIFQSETEPTEFVLHERYANEEALEFHKNSDHYQNIVVKQIIPLLEVRELMFVKKLS
ncbi:antibiotic biosynthesis monooxygenase [Flavobacterium sp. MAH-1]|uniref:Antibiotic biosynthesis monooxygenase n=1 Tax=Flavobacterium agri TaxID=2743471 RepID=A0A7Y8Y576_9FLAO|nr:putative quinol monooxygenase [Flavobacterium agri]NUY81486.1 antibiotic biosynthesis monooxygenase [Flavobacterium agri]NYA71510.1 antibiotic biosynthesis monooxygenase [Flavobacterium agri]